MDLTSNTTTLLNQTSSTIQLPFPSLLILFLTLQQIIFVVACTSNLFVIYTVLRYMSLKDSSNVFILNLAIADFFTGISTGIQILYMFYRHLDKNAVTCLLRYQGVGSMTIASQVTVFLLSIDRYIAVCFPECYKGMTSKKLSIIFVTLPWLVSMSLSVPPFFGWNNFDIAHTCSYSLLFTPDYFWTIAITVCSLNLFSFVAHFLIFNEIRKFHKRTSPLIALAIKDKIFKRGIRGSKVMLFITIVFTICWIPSMSLSFAYANGYTKDSNLNEASFWLAFLGILNSVLNPVIYAWYKNDFRKACHKACSCCYEQHQTD